MTRRRPWIRIAALALPTLLVAGAWLFIRVWTDGWWTLAHEPGLVMVTRDHLWVETVTGPTAAWRAPDDSIEQIVFPTKDIGPWRPYAAGAVEIAPAMKPVNRISGYPVRIYRISLLALLLLTLPTFGLAVWLGWRSTRPEPQGHGFAPVPVSTARPEGSHGSQ
jgi:hypothetical protein